MLRLTASASSFFGTGVGGLDTGGVEDEAADEATGGAEEGGAEEGRAGDEVGLTTAGDGRFFFCCFLFDAGTSLGPDIC